MFLKICAAIYAAVALMVFVMNLTSGPVTLGLSAARAVAWPLALAAGKPVPAGVRF